VSGGGEARWRWRDGEMRCDEAHATDFFPFSSLLYSSSSFRVLLSLDHFIYILSIFTSSTTISLHLLLPPPQRPPQNANPCSQVPLPSFPTLARHETHYRSTLHPSEAPHRRSRPQQRHCNPPDQEPIARFQLLLPTPQRLHRRVLRPTTTRENERAKRNRGKEE
jgi:hypothetical protein